MRLLAIDPASKKCGCAYFKDGILTNTRTLQSTADTPLERRLEIAERLGFEIIEADVVVCEEPFLMGRNNNYMQRLLGVVEFLTAGNVHFIHPQSVKKYYQAGQEKLAVALAAGELLETDDEKEILADAIRREDFDSTDAVAIGLMHIKGAKSEA